METYKIHVKCENCGYTSNTPDQMIEILRGVTIDAHLCDERCPRCGCKELEEIRY